MFQAPQAQEINFSNLNYFEKTKFHIAQDKSAYHDQGLMNLFIQGHVSTNQIKGIASGLKYPTALTQVRHLAAYENYTRDNTVDKPEWFFTGYSLHPHYQTKVVNGRAIAKEAFYVELNDRDIACSIKPVPVTALFYNGLQSSTNTTEYMDAIIALDLQMIENEFGFLPAPHKLFQFVSDNSLESFERPVFIEVMDKETGKFVFASLPSTDIEAAINQIKVIASTGIYADNREINYSENGRPYISLNYDSQSIDFNQSGDFGEREYLVQRIITAMKRGFALNISQLDSDSYWFDFSRKVLGNGLYIELPAFTELEHA